MKKLMIPPTIMLETSCTHRNAWKGMRGYCDGAVFARRSNGFSMLAIVVLIVASKDCGSFVLQAQPVQPS